MDVQRQLEMLAIIEESEFDNSAMFNEKSQSYNNQNYSPNYSPTHSNYNPARYSQLEEATYNSFLSLFDDQKFQKSGSKNYLTNSTTSVPNSRYSTSSTAVASVGKRVSTSEMSTTSGTTIVSNQNRFTMESNVIFDKKEKKVKENDDSVSRSMINLDFYDLTSEDYNGVPFNFSLLFDKVVMIVNVASFCHFTRQYKQLETLYEKYNSKGFEIIAFPSNQFLQEPKAENDIVEFCSLKFNVSFPIMKKIKVNGKKTSPIYGYLKNQKKGSLNQKRVLWNFEKFLIDKRGNVVERAWAFSKPKEFEALIVKLLDE